MKLCRLGFMLPQSYIDHHNAAARAELSRLESELGLIVHRVGTKPDGWMCDRMRIVTVVVETRSGRLLKLEWHPEGGSGVFFISKESGGSSRSHDRSFS